MKLKCYLWKIIYKTVHSFKYSKFDEFMIKLKRVWIRCLWFVYEFCSLLLVSLLASTLVYDLSMNISTSLFRDLFNVRTVCDVSMNVSNDLSMNFHSYFTFTFNSSKKRDRIYDLPMSIQYLQEILSMTCLWIKSNSSLSEITNVSINGL